MTSVRNIRYIWLVSFIQTFLYLFKCKTASRVNGRCWSNLDLSSKLADVCNANSMCNVNSFYNPYKIQSDESLDLGQNYESSAPTPFDHCANTLDPSPYYPPWSAYGYEMRQVGSSQIMPKIPFERNEFGSETDLYGLVSNILEEPEKAQSYFTEGISQLTSAWPLGANRVTEHQDFRADSKRSGDFVVFQKNLYGTGQASAADTQKTDGLYHGPSGLAQDGQWLYSNKANNTGSYNEDTKVPFQEYPVDKNSFSTSTLMPDAMKDYSQKRAESLASQFNRYAGNTEPLQYETKPVNRANLSFQGCINALNGSSNVPDLDIDSYTKFIQATQSCQKLENVMPDQQNYKFAKTPYLLSDEPYQKESPFLPNFNLKSDYGLKRLSVCEVGGEFANGDTRNSGFLKDSCLVPSLAGAASIRSLPWMNGHSERSDSPSLYYNKSLMTKTGSHISTSHKSCAQNTSYPSVCSPPPFRRYCEENHGYPVFEYFYNGADKTPEGLYKSLDEGLADSFKNKKLNGLCQNLSSHSIPVDIAGNRAFPEKPQGMQYNIEKKNLGYAHKSNQRLMDGAVNYTSNRQGSGDRDALNGGRLPLLHSGCLSNTFMMGDMRRTVSPQPPSTSYRSSFPHIVGRSISPFIESSDTNAYEDFGPIYPHFGDLIRGHGSLGSLPTVFSNQPFMRSRVVPGNELHVRLEECYEQLRAMEKERKRTEQILLKHYPGTKVSSANNTPIPRLTANPSRVDRLVVDQLRERARVVTLLGKMERFRSSPLHANIPTALDRLLEAIHVVQARRKDELVNASNRQRQGGPRHKDDKDVFALASSIKDMAAATRKARTALWCAMQMTVPKTPPSSSAGNSELASQTTEKPHENA